ncbi:hemoglobin-like protein (Hmp) [Sulfuricella denitrificans skB26]|uniref:Hemoglobin-like protein (Hmp) n=1 Tax=Sulfuricella denitrificans (strain DSM 22764 / NBRC 105220 / skB26) TaxID=1163617 RepID=S6AMN0_SULDS|nr:globin family protein [Sulfuricella denitrificans]BAN36069.1 hemoglobin-like protein (Hmp) [Sulfuricella denitrificans skB26]
MTPEKIALVRSSWQQVVPIQDTAAGLFYNRLFELDPSLRNLFNGDMVEQGRKLMIMINMVVNSLDRLESIIGMVKESGRRHVGYGVKAEHFDTVGNALIWTLGQGLGAGFTPEVKEGWVEAYGVLASTMKQAAYGSA